MSTPLDAIAKSIRLVPLGDQDFADKDKKVVWHHGDEGFDLVTHVDDQGLVVEQELATGDDLALWRAGRSIRTGRLLREPGGQSTRPRSGIVTVDPRPRDEVLQRLHEILRHAPADDVHIAHIAKVIADAAAESAGKPGELKPLPGNATLAEPNLRRLFHRRGGK